VEQEQEVVVLEQGQEIQLGPFINLDLQQVLVPALQHQQ
jgi:hypothetical protein